MKIWQLSPGQPAVELEVPEAEYFERAREFIGATLDVTQVVYRGKRRPMLVDDNGYLKGLPVNPEATTAYHAACRPGTTWSIRGRAVVLERDAG